MANFVVTHEKINSSVTHYGNARDSIALAVDTFAKVEDCFNWDDEARNTWNGIYSTYSTYLTEMKDKIDNNYALMVSMQAAANKDQTRTIAGISQIMK